MGIATGNTSLSFPFHINVLTLPLLWLPSPDVHLYDTLVSLKELTFLAIILRVMDILWSPAPYCLDFFSPSRLLNVLCDLEPEHHHSCSVAGTHWNSTFLFSLPHQTGWLSGWLPLLIFLSNGHLTPTLAKEVFFSLNEKNALSRNKKQENITWSTVVFFSLSVRV